MLEFVFAVMGIAAVAWAFKTRAQMDQHTALLRGIVDRQAEIQLSFDRIERSLLSMLEPGLSAHEIDAAIAHARGRAEEQYAASVLRGLRPDLQPHQPAPSPAHRAPH